MRTDLPSPTGVDAGYPIRSIRSDFPALTSGFAYFDGPGGTQTPRQVGEAIASTLTGPLSNRGSGAPSQRNADAAVMAFRRAMADLLDAEPAGIVYGRSATQLTYDFSRTLAMDWRPDDEVVVTRLDHDANVRPWVQAAEARGAVVRWADFDVPTSELTVEHVASLLTDRTRVVAITAASNLLGTKPPVRAIADAAHEAGALVYVDCVHGAAHAALSLREMGADVMVCSPYKFLGPHCGVLAASPELLAELHPDKLLPSTDAVPERFEYGTLPYETLAGVTAAVEYLAAVACGSSAADTSAADTSGAGTAAAGSLAGGSPASGSPNAGTAAARSSAAGSSADGSTAGSSSAGGSPDAGSAASWAAEAGSPAASRRRARLEASFRAIEEHEDRLRRRIEDAVAGLPGVRLWSRAAHRTPTLLLTFEGRTAAEASQHLLGARVLAPAGNFYALEASRHLGLGPAGGLRIGLAPYSDGNDVDRLVEGLMAFVEDR